MLSYVLRRVLLAFPTLVGVSLVTFMLFNLSAPPEAIARRSISAKNPTQEQIDDWLNKHGYDKPLPERFVKHMTEVTLFQFGRSDSSGEDIWARIRQGAPVSLTLGVLILVAALITDVSLALFLAYFRRTYIDYSGLILCVLLMSISYVVYLIFGQFLIGKVLKYFPLGGYREGLDSIRFLLAPMTVGVISGLGSTVRLYRTFVTSEINQDYVRTARAKGVPETAILFQHVLKNAGIPILTSVVLSIPLLFLGGLLIESFFAIPGLGGYLVDAINGQDFAVVRAMVYLGGALYITGSILTDVSYALVDPRVRLS